MRALVMTSMMAATLAGGAVAAAPTPTAHHHAPAESQKAIADALADPARADQAGDDTRRQAAAVLAFAGVGPGDTVIDFLPGQGYWTRILSGVVGPQGHVDAVWPSFGAKYAEKTLPALQARHLANVTAEVQATPLPTATPPVDLFRPSRTITTCPPAASPPSMRRCSRR